MICLRNGLLARTSMLARCAAPVASRAVPMAILHPSRGFRTSTFYQQQKPVESHRPAQPSLFPVGSTKSAPLVTVYEGPLARTVRVMKLFSISSLAATYAMAPLVFYVDVSDLISDSVKAIMIGTAMVFSTASTSLIHWCLKSYVTRIHVRALPAAEAARAHETVTDVPVEDAPAVGAVRAALKNREPIVFETLAISGRPKYTVARDIDAVHPHQVIFGTWRADEVLDARTGKLAGKAPVKLFVHAQAAVDGALGDAALEVADAVGGAN
ncbi:hypothetical protein AMAG_13886 [Allomyces macrogynus ATCC 38327]|uniref:Uncharacterized protein n=1 Tax=Allomyces macrogynus (strain ATCC 38327) TaxID=578462 RepID=A0A0L0T2U2_ALLM3|nr:hypothetical protein AMAG_13886 [Allomyces macrogynus ATCC 38327]|eukprot:KNE69012.1 hypothetical protein AMAG_13886 [Allomyces macrogynus ATCC 38327]